MIALFFGLFGFNLIMLFETFTKFASELMSWIHWICNKLTRWFGATKKLGNLSNNGYLKMDDDEEDPRDENDKTMPPSQPLPASGSAAMLPASEAPLNSSRLNELLERKPELNRYRETVFRQNSISMADLIAIPRERLNQTLREEGISKLADRQAVIDAVEAYSA